MRYIRHFKVNNTREDYRGYVVNNVSLLTFKATQFTIVVTKKDEEVFVGIARLAPNDTFTKRIGVAVAETNSISYKDFKIDKYKHIKTHVYEAINEAFIYFAKQELKN